MENAESNIIQLLKDGKERGYKYLYDNYYGLLCNIAYEYVKDSHIAQSIVEDTIFHLWEIRENIQINISLRYYLIRSVRNRSLNYLNLKRQKYEVPLSSIPQIEDQQSSSDDIPLGILLSKELEIEIKRAINQLPKECKTVFIKSRFEGKKYEEIASEMDITPHTVKYHIRNALSQLHKDLMRYMILITAILFY